MGQNAKSLALVRLSDGTVETFLRLDTPQDWPPPDGYTVIPDDELPENWQLVPPTDPVPETISARQIRLWLVSNGVSMAAVDAAINSIEDELIREQVRVEWEYAPWVERTHPWLVPLAAALGLTEPQIDAAFRAASQI